MARLHDDRGETLVELVITVLIMGVGLVAILGAIGSTIIAGDAHRSMASSEVVMRDYAEAVKATGSAAVALCPGAADHTPSGYAPPAGWSVSIQDIEWWIRDTGSLDAGHFGDQADCVSQLTAPGCGADVPACDPGLRRLTLSVSNSRSGAAARATTSVILVRRGNP